MNRSILALARKIEQRESAAQVLVVDVKGASPAKVGAQLVLFQDGSTSGTVGGGKLEASIIANAKQDLAERKCGLHHYQLAEEGPDAIGTLCGGELTVFVKSYFPQPQLVIVGGGHIGRPLKVMGEAAGYEVVVVDVSPGLETIPQLEQVSLTSDSYVVLITTDHVSDEAALRIALQSPAPYIGMIGSQAKCRTIVDHLRADDVSEEDLERVYAPIGLDLGCTSPQEIAVGILAEVIAVRCKKIPGNMPVKTRRLEPQTS
jgi:xanthine dehydrogenase accessory factor